MKAVGITLALVLLAGTAWAQQDPKDAGIADTLRFSGGELIVGRSLPVDIVIVTDTPIISIGLAAEFETLDSGFARLDSVVFVNHLFDPTILDQRYVRREGIDGVSPDSVPIGLVKLLGDASLPQVHEAVMRMYLTGITPGRMVIDTAQGMLGYSFKFHSAVPNVGWAPILVPDTLNVTVEQPRPELTLPADQVIAPAGVEYVLDVPVSSAIDSNVEVLDWLMFEVDDDARQVASEPEFTPGNPGRFSWTPNVSDIGIWRIIFRACDVSSNCVSGGITMSVVASGLSLPAFARSETIWPTMHLSLIRGDFTNDGSDEIVTTNGPSTGDVMSLIGIDNGQFSRISGYDDGYYKRGLVVGYFDDDADLDVRMFSTILRHIRLLKGDGRGNLIPGETSSIGDVQYACSAELTSDQYLDYVAVGRLGFTIMVGQVGHLLAPGQTYATPDSARSVNAADVNADGFADLLIGHKSGLTVYLGDGAGHFTEGATYSQSFAAADIDVTNQGSDFNSDDVFDLCVAAPSVGEEFSDIMLYLGNGDGTFNQHLVKRVRGQTLATVIGDYNNDQRLDIAYINGSQKFIGILFGDGQGGFIGEQRLPALPYTSRRLEATDYGRDGDLDFVVSAVTSGLNGILYLFENEGDPTNTSPQRLECRALDNSSVEIIAPSGQVITELRRTIASGTVAQRNIDDDALIDQVFTASAIEPGPYTISVDPKKGSQANQPFSIDFSVDGKQYRLAHDQPNRLGGYQFTVYPDGSSPVTPASGALCSLPNPQLTWTSSGDEILEIASDLAFTDIIETANITEGRYTPVHAVAGADTSTYYWRVKNVQSTWVSDIRVFSVLPTPTAVDPEANDGLPIAYNLFQNYPNPFNPTTTIAFALPQAERVVITIYDITGRQVRRLIDQLFSAGEHSVTWDGADNRHRSVSSGVYLYRIEAGSYLAQKKMTLVR